jgi:hypothetical protein
MTTTATVPLHVETAAAGRINELGLQREFEAMVAHTRQTVSNLRSIEVKLYDDPDEPGQPRLTIIAWRNGPQEVDDPTHREWDAWVIQTFPPWVLRWFGFDALSWDECGR